MVVQKSCTRVQLRHDGKDDIFVWFTQDIFLRRHVYKAQGASERTKRKPSEPERFSELGRTRIGLERSGCTEIFHPNLIKGCLI